MEKQKRGADPPILGHRTRGAKESLLFFPGDIQDQRDNMYLSRHSVMHRRPPMWSAVYWQYSYESTLLDLRRRFPQTKYVFRCVCHCSVFIVPPKEKRGQVSVYSNFYDCDDLGDVRECMWSLVPPMCRQQEWICDSSTGDDSPTAGREGVDDRGVQSRLLRAEPGAV